MNHFFLWLKPNDLAIELLKPENAPDRTSNKLKAYITKIVGIFNTIEEEPKEDG